jgi:hypothetical protein
VTGVSLALLPPQIGEVAILLLVVILSASCVYLATVLLRLAAAARSGTRDGGHRSSYLRPPLTILAFAALFPVQLWVGGALGFAVAQDFVDRAGLATAGGALVDGIEMAGMLFGGALLLAAFLYADAVVISWLRRRSAGRPGRPRDGVDLFALLAPGFLLQWLIILWLASYHVVELWPPRWRPPLPGRSDATILEPGTLLETLAAAVLLAVLELTLVRTLPALAELARSIRSRLTASP